MTFLASSGGDQWARLASKTSNVVSSTIAWVFKPSWAALAGVVTVVVLFFSCLSFPSNQFIHQVLSVYPGFQRLSDDRSFLFHQVTRFISEPKPDNLVVAIVGGSTTRESIWNEAYLADRIGIETGRKAVVFDVTSSGQGLITSLALAEIFACNGADLIVVGANMGRMNKIGPFDTIAYFGYTSEAADIIAAKSDPEAVWDRRLKSDLAFRSHLASKAFRAASRQLRNVDQGRGHRHQYLNRHQPAKRQAKISSALVTHTMPPSPLGHSILKEIVGLSSKCDAKILLMQTTMLPELLDPTKYPIYRKAYDVHIASMRDLTRNHGRFFDVNNYLSLGSNDFFDWGHLSNEGAVKAASDAIALNAGKVLQSN